MNIELTWPDFKNEIANRSIGIHYVTTIDYYYITAFDGPLCFFSRIPLDGSDPTEKDDFEANFKNAANKNIIANTAIEVQPPYGSKTITVNGVAKKLFSRFTGVQYALNQGTNTLTYTATYPWAKLIGVEAINCEALDIIDFKVYDNAQGTYSGTPNAMLNQFAFTMNLPKDFYQRLAQFDADIYAGMIIHMTYVSMSAKTLGINFLLDQVK